MLRTDTDESYKYDKLKPDETSLLQSFRSFCEKSKKRKIPNSLRLGMHLSADLGLDSLAQVDFIVHVEEQFGTSIDPDRFSSVQTLQNLLDLLNETSDSSAGGDAYSGLGITELQRRLIHEIPQFYNDVDEQVGRKLKIKGKLVIDFASANYLGLDLDERIFQRIEKDLRKWGTHPSWSRAIASPVLYKQLETTLCRTVGAPRVLVYPTITLIHLGVLPLLATNETLFLVDDRAHKSIQEGVDLACAKGGAKRYFPHNDVDVLKTELDKAKGCKYIYVCVDGVYSMTGVDARLPEMVKICKGYANATLYVDDAHGFGLWGKDPSEANPYGIGGAGLLSKYNIDVCTDKVIYVAGLSKAFSSLGAFITCRSDEELKLFSTATTFINSGPCPTASLSSAQMGLEVSLSPEGDAIRRRVYDLTKRFVTGVREVGLVAQSENFFPLVSVEIGTISAVIEAAKLLWSNGILITPAVYPNAPIKRSMLRFTITAANTIDEIDAAIDALEIVRNCIPTAPYN